MMFWIIGLMGSIWLVLLGIAMLFFGVGFVLEERLHNRRIIRLWKLLSTIKAELHNSRFECWLDFDTLLGCYISGDIIKGDLYLDLGMRAEDVYLVNDVIVEKLKLKDVITVKSTSSIKFYSAKETNISVRFHSYEKSGYTRVLKHHDKLYTTSEADIFPLKEHILYQSKVHFPNNPHGCLLERYGNDYMRPVSFFLRRGYNKVVSPFLRCATTWRELLDIKVQPH